MCSSDLDKQYGARPMARFIQENVKKPLAEELLFGKLEKGGHVVITLKDDKLAFELTADPAPKKPDSEEDDAGEDKVPALVH